METLRKIWWALWPSLLIWIPYVIAVQIWDGLLPRGGWDGFLPSDGWQNFTAFALIITFLWTKSWLILRRMPYVDWLSLSLSSSNVAFVALYLFTLAAMTWPTLFYEGVPTPTPLEHWAYVLLRFMRLALIVILIWSNWMLVNASPVPPREDEVDSSR